MSFKLSEYDKQQFQIFMSVYCSLFQFVLGQPFRKGKNWLRRQGDKTFEEEFFMVVEFLRQKGMPVRIGKGTSDNWVHYLKYCFVDAKRNNHLPTARFITYPARLENYCSMSLTECHEVDRIARTLVKRKTQTDNIRSRFPNHGKPWAAEDRAIVGEQFKAGVSIQELSELLGRKLGAIQSELHHQKLVDDFRLPEELAKLDIVEEDEYEEIMEIVSEHPLLKPIPAEESPPEVDYSKALPPDLHDPETLAFLGYKLTEDGRIVGKGPARIPYQGSPKPGVTKRMVKKPAA